MNKIINPKIKEYLQFKGKINSFAFMKMIGEEPHPGQVEILNAYEERIPPREETILRAQHYGIDLDFDYAYDVIVAVCGRRFGKSWFASVLGAQELMIPYSHVLLASYTLDNCDIIFKQIREIIVKLKIEIVVDRKKDRELELANGARLTVASVENVESRLGNAVSLLILDEAKKFHKTLYEQVLVPMTADYSSYSRSILISSPEDGWLNTYYNYGISKDPDFSRYWSINLPTACNPTIPKAWIENARRTLPPDVFEQEILGLFTAGAGRVFYEFSHENNVRNSEYYPHLETWIRHNIVVNTLDTGFNHYTSSLYFVYVEEIDTYIFFAEYNKNKTTTPQHAVNMAELENEFVDREPDLRYADPAAAQSIADLAEHGFYYNSSEKNMRETVQFLNSLCYQKSEATGESKLIVLEDRCPETIRQLLTVKWKENQAKVTMESSNSKGAKPWCADLDRKSDWDCADAARYGLYSYGKNQRIAVNIFNSAADKDYDLTADEMAMYEAGYVKM